jgi:hypothetical protein
VGGDEDGHEPDEGGDEREEGGVVPQPRDGDPGAGHAERAAEVDGGVADGPADALRARLERGAQQRRRRGVEHEPRGREADDERAERERRRREREPDERDREEAAGDNGDGRTVPPIREHADRARGGGLDAVPDALRHAERRD